MNSNPYSLLGGIIHIASLLVSCGTAFGKKEEDSNSNNILLGVLIRENQERFEDAGRANNSVKLQLTLHISPEATQSSAHPLTVLEDSFE